MQGYVMFLKQRHKQNVKISNWEASNKGLHRVRRVQMQRQFGVINKNNLDVGGMRRKRCQAAFVEQTAFLSARMKDSKSKLVERGTRVCDLLRPASVQVPPKYIWGALHAGPFQTLRKEP